MLDHARGKFCALPQHGAAEGKELFPVILQPVQPARLFVGPAFAPFFRRHGAGEPAHRGRVIADGFAGDQEIRPDGAHPSIGRPFAGNLAVESAVNHALDSGVAKFIFLEFIPPDWLVGVLPHGNWNARPARGFKTQAGLQFRKAMERHQPFGGISFAAAFFAREPDSGELAALAVDLRPPEIRHGCGKEHPTIVAAIGIIQMSYEISQQLLQSRWIILRAGLEVKGARLVKNQPDVWPHLGRAFQPERLPLLTTWNILLVPQKRAAPALMPENSLGVWQDHGAVVGKSAIVQHPQCPGALAAIANQLSYFAARQLEVDVALQCLQRALPRFPAIIPATCKPAAKVAWRGK